MKKITLVLLFILSTCTTPQQAASKTCDCLHEVVRFWEEDEKLKATLHFAECGKMQEDYRKEFSGDDLVEFEKAYQDCLETTIKTEGLRYLLK